MTIVVGLLAFQSIASAAMPRIVNGLPSHDFPSTGALLYGAGGTPIDADNAVIECSGTLIGCRTFLTAAHCVASDADPTHYQVYFQHAGIVPVASVTANPDYTGLGGHDVAIVKLATDVTGITPTPLNTTHDLVALGVGQAGVIAGFGQTAYNGRDFGIKRYGLVQTANCALAPGGEGNGPLVCWDFAIPVGPPGQDSDTCNGDSGGPLFMDFGGVTEIAGVTSAGSSPFCRPLDHSWDASVYYNAGWLITQLGTDSTSACGLDPVGAPTVTMTGVDGVLSGAQPSDTFTVDLAAGAAMLRVALNGQYNALFNVDLYVKAGDGASPSNWDCKADGLSVFGACSFATPAAGRWSIYVADASGAGEYQVTTTVFGGAFASCGNGVIEGSERCDDGAANGTAASCCSASCTLQPADTACADDGDVCTRDACDGATAICRHPAGNPGTVCRAAVGPCDVAETCTGTTAGCPADTGVPDADGDGLCDAIDPCTDVGHGQDFSASAHPKLVLTKIGPDPVAGNDGVRTTATFRLPSGLHFADLDPLARGARFLITDDGGATIVDAALPSGAYGGRGTRGWTRDAMHTTWQFKDTTAAPPGGLVHLRVKDRNRTMPGAVQIAVVGRKATYAVTTGVVPLHVTVVLGDQSDAIAGACGESAFGAGDCRLGAKGTTLTCRQ